MAHSCKATSNLLPSAHLRHPSLVTPLLARLLCHIPAPGFLLDSDTVTK